ncbi:hypothetical protein T440DRAFT_105857 [Plenodomus tracheiphilus IPT5]|uniref:Uncharacterized protein n=1 Tax=Plenodomus tracheiphilus IPT5 TaxID=1408161 RepID=A0A6A7BLN8_9PLEO|nr:hypothetical protein T440DRAFT_105857 [Plenodomus tracheiphilus IPT5]
MSQKGKGRKFFQQLQPTFAIDVPQSKASKLEFLDHSDPAKDLVVRKKAREWVNKNKAKAKQRGGSSKSQSKSRLTAGCESEEKDGAVVLGGDDKMQDQPVPLGQLIQPASITSYDPFGMLPEVGRKYDHIIQFFLTSCPEEIPCSDDKYSDMSKHSLVSFSSDNTVLGNMAKSKVTFILWLYATVTIRDGMGGCVDTEEVRWFYSQALLAIQETLKKDEVAGEYSEDVLKAIGCITAAASFSGMFKTAELHSDAMVRLLRIRGDGDILAGLRSTAPWTAKALQWCEIMVATQLVEPPTIPYYVPVQPCPAPEIVIKEATRLTKNSLVNLPPLSGPLRRILGLFHHLGVAHAQINPVPKIDLYVLQPLYDAEYLLLRVLVEQKSGNHDYSNVEILLAETFQLYFWTGPRALPPQTRLCDLLISRIMRALLPFLLEAIPEVDLEYSGETAASVLDHMANWVDRSFSHPRNTSNAILWSLALGTIVSASLDRPEHAWFKGHFRNYMQLMGLDKDEQEYLKFIDIFPATEGFSWINVKTLYREFAE